MTYRVAFSKRYQSDGRESVLDPTSELDVNLPDGVVADKVFVERFEPEAKHNQEVLDEDDAFLGLSAAEVWEYEVLDERAQEFEDAIRNSETVMEFQVIDETSTDSGDITGSVPLGDGDTAASEEPSETGEVTRTTGSGVRGGDDGPGGQPTGDTTAGGLARGEPYLGMDEVDGISNEGGGLDDLNVVSADDPQLGLTNYKRSKADDWAADTGESRSPDRGVASSDIADDASTLAPARPPDRRG